MSLDLHDFDAFFAEFHDGQSPFDWQRELLDRLLRTGRWPSSIVAPTGAGKSSVLHIHVFAQAIAAGSERLRLPRRLVHIVGRRALVDDMSVSALVLSSRLQQALDAEAPSVLGEVAHALRTAGEHHDLLPVTVLRGGSHRSAAGWMSPRPVRSSAPPRTCSEAVSCSAATDPPLRHVHERPGCWPMTPHSWSMRPISTDSCSRQPGGSPSWRRSPRWRSRCLFSRSSRPQPPPPQPVPGTLWG